MDKQISIAKEVLEIEAQSIMAVSGRVDRTFTEVVGNILSCKGRVIVCGMGKSGIIGRKISSTLACTGTPSFFMHPAEAFHGDLGVLTSEDILLMISYSGETEEILKIIPSLKEIGNLLVSMTGNTKSTLAKSSDLHLDVNVRKEACPLQLAPTSSTTVALAMGDALAIVVMKERGFNEEQFARLHPGGRLGRRLLLKVENVMKTDRLPIIAETDSMKDVIHVMMAGQKGIAIALNEERQVVGFISDGDLRRCLNLHENVFTLQAKDIMSTQPKTISKHMKLYDAEKIFNEYKITSLIVADDDNRFHGLLFIHDI